MKDQYGRTIDYIRISVTDRCNLRCRYCMPEEGIPSIGHENVLTFEEILLLCRCVSRLGIHKIKLTGGEPLVRKGFIELVREIRQIPAIEEVTMTTNGILLGEYLEELKAAGLDRINISLDTLDPDKYKEITRGGDLSLVLDSMERACKLGFSSIKINALMMEEWNRNEVALLAGLARTYPLSVRFIEMMPLGLGSGFSPVCQEKIMRILRDAYGTLRPSTGKIGNGPATYYDIEGFQGKIGFISAVSHAFCQDCNRVRVTADGNLKLCLQYKDTLNIRKLLQCGTREDQLVEILRRAIFMKPGGHDFKTGSVYMSGDRETKGMSQIGG